MSRVAHLIFDVESVADGDLVASLKYPDEKLTAEAAIRRFQEELVEQSGKTFIPYTYQVPVAVVIAKVDKDLELIDIVSLDEPQFRPHVIAEHFWRGWELYGRPQWVTFNGRGFDLPLMELAAFRYGLSVPAWFHAAGPSYKHCRNRYNVDAHFDLHEFLTNFNATWFRGGLDLAAQLIGKPGKIDVKGDQVQEMYHRGEGQAISDYCRCDVLDTYFVFLRSMVVMGRLNRDRERELVATARDWLEQRKDDNLGYSVYLENWGEWSDPWQTDQPVTSGGTSDANNGEPTA
ncbi:MAG: 3'-5' exonuclease [Planctomycetaceae bacterium]|nr:MAG: 3'-5' exonuclease [Planctomycetaceae bacterium]